MIYARAASLLAPWTLLHYTLGLLQHSVYRALPELEHMADEFEIRSIRFQHAN